MTLADDEHPVGAFAAYGAHPALGERVRAGRLRRSPDQVDAGAAGHRIGGCGEFRIPIAYQEPQPGSALIEVHQQVPGLVGHPGTGRMRRHPNHMDLAGGDLHEEQHVDPLEEHRVDGEEIAGQDRVRLGGQKTASKSARRAAARGRRRTVEDLPDGAGRHA
jgi:hypothetical protein